MEQLLSLLGRKHGGDRLVLEALCPCRIDEVWDTLCCSIKCRHNIRVRRKDYLLSMMVSILPNRTKICGLCVAALESGSSIRVASSARKFHGYILGKMLIYVLSSCRDQIMIFSLHELDTLSRPNPVDVVHLGLLPSHQVMHPAS